MPHYVHDDYNNRVLALSKEEIYALLSLAIQQGQLPSVAEDTAFVTMLKSITDNETYKIAFCTQATYNELETEGELVANCLYIITDDETYANLVTAIENLHSAVENLQNAINNLAAVATTGDYNDLINKLTKVTGTISFASASSTLAALINDHEDIKFWYKYSSSGISYYYPVIVNKTFNVDNETYTLYAFYVNNSGVVTAIANNTTLHYEYTFIED